MGRWCFPCRPGGRLERIRAARRLHQRGAADSDGDRALPRADGDSSGRAGPASARGSPAVRSRTLTGGRARATLQAGRHSLSSLANTFAAGCAGNPPVLRIEFTTAQPRLVGRLGAELRRTAPVSSGSIARLRRSTRLRAAATGSGRLFRTPLEIALEDTDGVSGRSARGRNADLAGAAATTTAPVGAAGAGAGVSLTLRAARAAAAGGARRTACLLSHRARHAFTVGESALVGARAGLCALAVEANRAGRAAAGATMGFAPGAGAYTVVLAALRPGRTASATAWHRIRRRAAGPRRARRHEQRGEHEGHR